MSIIFVLIPLGMVLLAVAIWAFVWAVNNDQFEDLERAGQSILFDDDEAPIADPDEVEAPEAEEAAGDESDEQH